MQPMKALLSTTAMITLLTVSSVAFADSDSHGKDGKGEHPFMEEALSKLPEKDAATFRDTMKQSHEKDKDLFEKSHKMHEELHALLAADTFDKAAYVAKSKELAKIHATMHDHMTEAFATAVSKLPPDERKILADNIHEMHKGMHHGHHHHDGKDNADGDKPSSADAQ